MSLWPITKYDPDNPRWVFDAWWRPAIDHVRGDGRLRDPDRRRRADEVYSDFEDALGHSCSMVPGRGRPPLNRVQRIVRAVEADLQADLVADQREVLAKQHGTERVKGEAHNKVGLDLCRVGKTIEARIEKAHDLEVVADEMFYDWLEYHEAGDARPLAWAPWSWPHRR